MNWKKFSQASLGEKATYAFVYGLTGWTILMMSTLVFSSIYNAIDDRINPRQNID